uniref:Reverse transcriptase domain-containing protein n=1 Tax=Amphimedon queenslandica TaxID=400682 RepID=A0A1X7TYV7_AMPQE
CFLLQEKLDAVLKWSDEWDLKFNLSKTSLVRFSKRNCKPPPYDYTNLGNSNTTSNTIRDLGVHFSSDLLWSNHITIVIAKAYKMLGFLKRSFSCNDITVRKRLYVTLVRSLLSYGSQVWRPSLIRDIVNLERIQRRASKFILSDYKCTYKDRLIRLSLLPLAMYLEYLDISFMLRCYKDSGSNFDLSSYISGLLTLINSNTTLPTLLFHPAYISIVFPDSGINSLPLTFPIYRHSVSSLRNFFGPIF